MANRVCLGVFGRGFCLMSRAHNAEDRCRVRTERLTRVAVPGIEASRLYDATPAFHLPQTLGPYRTRLYNRSVENRLAFLRVTGWDAFRHGNETGACSTNPGCIAVASSGAFRHPQDDQLQTRRFRGRPHTRRRARAHVGSNFRRHFGAVCS